MVRASLWLFCTAVKRASLYLCARVVEVCFRVEGLEKVSVSVSVLLCQGSCYLFQGSRAGNRDRSAAQERSRGDGSDGACCAAGGAEPGSHYSQ